MFVYRNKFNNFRDSKSQSNSSILLEKKTLKPITITKKPPSYPLDTCIHLTNNRNRKYILLLMTSKKLKKKHIEKINNLRCHKIITMIAQKFARELLNIGQWPSAVKKPKRHPLCTLQLQTDIEDAEHRPPTFDWPSFQTTNDERYKTSLIEF